MKKFRKLKFGFECQIMSKTKEIKKIRSWNEIIQRWIEINNFT